MSTMSRPIMLLEKLSFHGAPRKLSEYLNTMEIAPVISLYGNQE